MGLSLDVSAGFAVPKCHQTFGELVVAVKVKDVFGNRMAVSGLTVKLIGSVS